MKENTYFLISICFTVVIAVVLAISIEPEQQVYIIPEEIIDIYQSYSDNPIQEYWERAK